MSHPLSRISWHLPLSTGALLVAVVTAFSWIAYREVRQAAVGAATERLEHVARQLASLLVQSVSQRIEETTRLAANAAVRALVEMPDDKDRVAGARVPLAMLLHATPQIAALEIWTVERERLAEETNAGAPAIQRRFPDWAGREAVAVSGIRSSAGALWYEIAAAVREQERTIGYVIQYRRFSSSPQAVGLITELIGSDARFLLGERHGAWTDLIGPADAPRPVTNGLSRVAEYEDADGSSRLGTAAEIPGTSWLIWVEFPTASVLAGPQDFLRRVLLGAAAIVLLGAAGAWVLSRRITRPLAHLTGAASAIAAGDYSRRVPAERQDELGKLAEAFNGMCASLQQVLADNEAARDALRSSEESFRHLFAANPLPMWVYDVETLEFLEVNEAAVARYGYSRDEFLGMQITAIRPPEDVPRLLEVVSQPRPGLSYAGEWRHRLKDGRIIDVDITAHHLVFAGRQAELVVAQDITARKRAEAEVRQLTESLERQVAERTAALQASEEQFRTLAVTAYDAIVTADSAGRITYVNPGAERMFGYDAAELVGRPLTILMPESFRTSHARGLARYLATGESRVIGRTVELEGRRKDGSEFPLELSLASWRHNDDAAFAGILRDISTRREAERERRRQAADLEAANKELEAFSYSVSHDLRAPLRSIHGFSQALLEDYTDRLDARGAEYLRRVSAGAQRMSQLIDDLLELARVSRSELHRQPVDLGAIARRIAEELRRRQPDRRVEFRIADAAADADPRLAGLVLQNLLDNAWKFTSKKPQATIEFGTLEADHERAFFIRDDGAGFDMAYAEKLFGPFQRLHGAKDFPGTGVGLAIVQRIVRRHGGRVWAEGSVDAGATFYFTLGDVQSG